MKLQKKQGISVFVALMLVMVAIFSTDISMNVSQAAVKTKLSDTEKTIGIGTYGNDSYASYNKSQKYMISVKSPVKNAIYKFTSSNKKLVTVKASGTKAYLTGVGYGTSMITCSQTLNGKTTIIGKCKVIVKKSYIFDNGMSGDLNLGTYKIGSEVHDPVFKIFYRNPEAKYTYSTGSSNLIIKDKKYAHTMDEVKGYFSYAQEFTAKKAGTYTVTVKETYKNKTRNVGTIKVTVNDVKIEQSFSIYQDSRATEWDFFDYRNADMNYYLEGDGFDLNKKNQDSVLYIDKDEEGYSYIYAGKVGTVKVNIYEGTSEANKKLIGSCTVTVLDDSMQSISFYDNNDSTYVGAEFYISVKKVPEESMDEIIYTSSDENILMVKEDGYGGYEFIPLKEGTVTLTAKSGDKTDTCTVTVYATEDEYYDAQRY